MCGRLENDSSADKLGILGGNEGCRSFCCPAELKAAGDKDTVSWKQLEDGGSDGKCCCVASGGEIQFKELASCVPQAASDLTRLNVTRK